MPEFKDAWGFSKLDTYWTCPAKFKFAFIDKIKDLGSAAMDRGSAIHTATEEYLNGWRPTMPPEAALHFREKLETLKNDPSKQTEAAWGFNADWTARKDWFGKDCWLRVKLDAHHVLNNGKCLVVIDFKTGKFRDPSIEQVELYAIAGSIHYPDAETIRAEFWFFDTGETYVKEYTREQLVGLRAKYEGYVKQIYADRIFEPTPSRECRWCQHSRTKGGPCKF